MHLRTLGLAGAALGGLLTLATLPALVAPAAPSIGPCGETATGSLGAIEATIRHLESGGDYQARAAGSSASGAYQFLDSTWAGYGGYQQAWLAPPDVQDAKAGEYIASILAANGDQVSAVPVVWYIGHIPAPGSPEWDTVPAPGAGNRLTPRQYQARWLDIYRSKLSGGQGGDITHPPATAPTSHCGGGTGDVLPGGWALPGPRAVLDATADQIDNPHHDHPAWDWAIPQGTPVYAVRGGTVVGYSDNPHNCNGQASCDACGLGLTIADDQGVQWTYCHGSAHHVHRGDIVTAGQQILDSGNTGNSTGPHLHLAIRAAGIARCPQPLVASLYRSSQGLDPMTLPSAGCTY